MLPPTKQHAFTIIEILVVTAIVGLLFAMTIPNLQRFGIKNQLRTVKNQLKAQIQQTKTWSTAVKNGTNVVAGSTPFDDQLVAYAITFDQDGSGYQIWEVWQDDNKTHASIGETPSARITQYTWKNAEIAIDTINGAPIEGLNEAQRTVIFDIPFGTSQATFNAEGKVILVLTFRNLNEVLTISQSGSIY